VVKFVLAMHEPRVRFTAATSLLLLLDGELVCKDGYGFIMQPAMLERKTFGICKQVVMLGDKI
jgi:hypothetical protein